MEYLDITKEREMGDVITVPEHRAYADDTMAQLVSRLMTAYQCESMTMRLIDGSKINFRKVV